MRPRTKRGVRNPSALRPAKGRTVSPLLSICVTLAIVTAVVYAPVRLYDFVDLDDPEYVTDNPHVPDGLTVSGVAWAFTAGYAANWHPLTWLSHMADVQLYGVSAGAHHLTNVLLHIANALLLFGFFQRTTGATGRSAFVAGVFALHPLHVESVAWIAERKDVLSTLLWMLTMWAYVGYVRRPQANRYRLVLGCFALGLMAKPMLVTLPFVLLLLDLWPLERATMSNVVGALRPARSKNDRVVVVRLLREKIPFFLLSAVVSIVTIFAQRRGVAFASLDAIPVGLRVANAITSYVAYIGKALWPTHLAFLYPYSRSLPTAWVLACMLLLVGLSGLLIRAGRRSPFLAIGWLWYLGTLVPVIGLVQVGSQSMADRYMYVPLIGLAIVTAWGVPELVGHRSTLKAFVSAAAIVVLVACAIASRAQVRNWKDILTLWEHTVRVTSANPFARLHLGVALEKDGRVDEAVAQYFEAARISSGVHYHGSESVLINLANRFLAQRQLGAAFDGYSAALRLNRNSADAHNGLGSVLGQQLKLDEAIAEFAEAVRLADDPKFHYNLAQVLEKKGRTAEAVDHLQKAVALDPTNARVRRALSDLRGR